MAKTERDRRIHTVKVELKRSEAERLEVLDGIRAQVAKYIFEEASQQLPSYISPESAAATVRLDTFLRAGHSRPAGTVAQRYAQAIARRIGTYLSRWVHENEQRLVRNVNKVTNDGFQRLSRNLNDLAVLPRKTFDLAIAEPAGIGEELGALSLEPKIEIDVGVGWSPRVRRSLRFCPTFMVRRWLRNDLQSELVTFISKQQSEALRNQLVNSD